MPSMGQPWRLPKGSDMVLQLHMRPSGKPEPIQSSLAFYFSDQPPTRTPCSFILRSTTIDIPAGEKNYIVRELLHAAGGCRGDGDSSARALSWETTGSVGEFARWNAAAVDSD